jgi:hypothetical protein
MTETTRVPVPSFSAAVATLLDTVSESPQATHRHAYLDYMGIPFDLTATWLARLDAPIQEAAAGTFEFNGPKHYNTARLPFLWNRLFVAYDTLGELPPDWPHITFRGSADLPDIAENFLVFVLLSRVQRALDTGLDWRGAAVRGLKGTRRFLHDKSSGARVQASRSDSSGRAVPPSRAHENMWQNVDSTIAKALASLSTKKEAQ